MTAARWENLRVLVVDDNQHMLHIVRTLLRSFGITMTEEARDPADAFETFRGVPVDIVIVDYMMDVLDGLDFVRLVRSGNDSPNPFVPIIMLTAYSERSRIIEARDAGVTEFLCKPVTAVDLYRKIQSVIERPRPFVRTGMYFGPDRRRHTKQEHTGEERRKEEAGPAAG
jgi:CheY-like chemotaxis protein